MTPVIDLVAFARVAGTEHKKLAGAIMALRDAQSIRADLGLAHEFIQTAAHLRSACSNSDAGSDAENASLALLCSVVVLYSRATKTKSRHRRSLNVEAQLDDAEKQAHTMICDLRDDAVAHFGPGGSYAGPTWQVDGVFILPDASGRAPIFTASRRLVMSAELMVTLSRQVHRILMLAERNLVERNAETAGLVTAALASDPLLAERLHENSISLADFLGSEQAARDVFGGPREGKVRGTIHH